MATLKEIRQKLKEQESKSTSGGDNGIYPFWDMKEGQTAIVRFLPDGDPNNTFFWVERLIIKIPFSGILGDAESRPVQVYVPCMEMFNETCPILSQIRPWFKDPSLEALGKKYWKKRSYLFQGLIVDDPLASLKDKTQSDNPIKRFIIGPQIFQIIKAALMDTDMDDLPTDFTHGLDFRLTKNSKGNYADYSTSSWARRERSLSDAEMKAIDTFGLFDMKSFLPAKPGAAELAAIEEMFEASVDGKLYDPSRWSQYYKPTGGLLKTSDPNKENIDDVVSSPSKSTEDHCSATQDLQGITSTTDQAKSATSAKDILAMIRSRQTS